MRKLKRVIFIIAAVVASVVILAAATEIYLEIIQLEEIGEGLSGVYVKNLVYKLVTSAVNFALIFVVISATNFFIARNLRSHMAGQDLPIRKLPNFSVSLVIALAGSFITRNLFYREAVAFFNAVDFGAKDPVFSRDIGYYVFQRPFLMLIYEYITVLWVFTALYTAVYYLIVFSMIYNHLTLHNLKARPVLRHNLINVSLFFVIRVFSYILTRENILYSDVIGATGAGFVENAVWLKYYYVAPVLLIGIILFSTYFILKGRFRKALIAIAVYPAVWLLALIISAAVQGFVVKPNEFQYESQYLKYNMESTRAAFGLDRARTIEIPSVEELTPEIIERNAGTKNNIRLVDFQATLDTNVQLQSNTLFYNFVDGDIINYTINGNDTPVFITAREIDTSRLPGTVNYINKTFKYTHGYGIVINPINQLSPQGQAEFILSGLRMSSKDPNLRVTEPRIYYGEMTRNHVIVNGKGINEIDYDGLTETRYNGTGGIRLGFLNRLLFSLKYADFNMLISGYITPESKLLVNRQVIERAQKGAPFLVMDNDPYIILTKDGRLTWVIDAYTTTSRYPYSQMHPAYGGINYIRNPVKVTVDAYNGDVRYYIIDNSDPIIRAYKKAYPWVFTEDPLPEDVRSHMRYPERLFEIQSEMLRKYHLDPAREQDVNSFYTNQDLWNIAQYKRTSDVSSTVSFREADAAEIEPYYNMIRLPEGVGEKEELILMRPFTPSGNKHNMVSWMAVRNSYENYGEMILFKFPKNTNILGPYQVEANINSIDAISKNISLWSQGESTVFKGSLLVIPIENSVLYVEPIYIRAAGRSSIPQVRQVVVGYQSGEEFRAGIGDNLDEALADLFRDAVKDDRKDEKPGRPDEEEPGEETREDRDDDGTTIEDLKEKYEEIRKQLEELGRLIEKLF